MFEMGAPYDQMELASFLSCSKVRFRYLIHTYESSMEYFKHWWAYHVSPITKPYTRQIFSTVSPLLWFDCKAQSRMYLIAGRRPADWRIRLLSSLRAAILLVRSPRWLNELNKLNAFVETRHSACSEPPWSWLSLWTMPTAQWTNWTQWAQWTQMTQ